VQQKFPNKIVFPLYFFYYNFEPNNPLSSKSDKSKIGAVYISIASVPVHISSLDNIFLAQMFFCRSNVIQKLKYIL